MDGIEKRWDWGLDSADNTYDYAISLGPDRTAIYYEFKGSKDGSAKPSGIYKCEK